MSGLLEDLRQTLASTPQNVVFIVGAGVSIGALHGGPRAVLASWGGLLHDGLRRIYELGALDARENAVYQQHLCLASPQALLSVADIVGGRLSAPHGGEFSRWLRETVGAFHHDIRDRSVLEALAAHQRRGTLLATTNYDHLLESVTALKPATWTRPAVVERAVRGTEPRVLHLHGQWEEPESIVLGTRSYIDVVRDPHAQAVLSTLRTAWTFVFVGCGAGLCDPNIGAFLRWTGEVFARSEVRHFRLCLASEIEALRREHPPEQRIFPLPFGNTHADLAPFLRRLLPPGGLHLGGGGAGPPLGSSSHVITPSTSSASSRGQTSFTDEPEFDIPPRLLQPGSRGTALVVGALLVGTVGAFCIFRESPSEPKSAPDVFRGVSVAAQKPGPCAELTPIVGQWLMTTSVNWTANTQFSGASGHYRLEIASRKNCIASIIVRKTGDSGKNRYKQAYQDRAEARIVAGADGTAIADFEAWLGPNKPVDKATPAQDGDWHYRFILRMKDGRMEGTWEMFDKKPGSTIMRGDLKGTRSSIQPGSLPSPL
ncbi:SIR2-like domain-containing protein [Nannocystis exedens]|uniref:SIR2-like domain-containing protein n=1 Tax=Nannocystis exedens TaxID=54 RepID=A0A1I2J4N9_9BACT|nr:SIR2 family protein [Nannocystis exedens]PCC68156.1 hypothetical protein NAEX_01165 [Nannocystis exedens]SFF47886.1 SIR2-like domain-containing protein [Nannocystis exedens]